MSYEDVRNLGRLAANDYLYPAGTLAGFWDTFGKIAIGGASGLITGQPLQGWAKAVPVVTGAVIGGTRRGPLTIRQAGQVVLPQTLAWSAVAAVPTKVAQRIMARPKIGPQLPVAREIGGAFGEVAVSPLRTAWKGANWLSEGWKSFTEPFKAFAPVATGAVTAAQQAYAGTTQAVGQFERETGVPMREIVRERIETLISVPTAAEGSRAADQSGQIFQSAPSEFPGVPLMAGFPVIPTVIAGGIVLLLILRARKK